MKSITTSLRANLKQYLVRSLCGLFLMLTIWQGMSLGVDTALAASSIEVVVPEGIGNNRSNIIKQLEEKEKLEEQQVQAAMKDGNQSTKESLDKAKDVIERTVNQAEETVKENKEQAKNLYD